MSAQSVAAALLITGIALAFACSILMLIGRRPGVTLASLFAQRVSSIALLRAPHKYFRDSLATLIAALGWVSFVLGGAAVVLLLTTGVLSE